MVNLIQNICSENFRKNSRKTLKSHSKFSKVPRYSIRWSNSFFQHEMWSVNFEWHKKWQFVHAEISQISNLGIANKFLIKF